MVRCRQSTTVSRPAEAPSTILWSMMPFLSPRYSFSISLRQASAPSFQPAVQCRVPESRGSWAAGSHLSSSTFSLMLSVKPFACSSAMRQAVPTAADELMPLLSRLLGAISTPDKPFRSLRSQSICVRRPSRRAYPQHTVWFCTKKHELGMPCALSPMLPSLQCPHCPPWKVAPALHTLVI